MTVPNAPSFELHRWFLADERVPTYQVAWTNATAFDDDDEEQERSFVSLDDALAFGRRLLEVKVCEECGAEADAGGVLCAACGEAE